MTGYFKRSLLKKVDKFLKDQNIKCLPTCKTYIVKKIIGLRIFGVKSKEKYTMMQKKLVS